MLDWRALSPPEIEIVKTPAFSALNPRFKICNLIFQTMPGSIIIADDYADNRELLRLILEMSGHRVREARDGRECVEMAHLEPPDIFLIDLSMPVLDGWGALKELRADERTRSIPCVAITAFADSNREHALQNGFNAYLTKPFRSKELIATVEQLLAASRSEESISSQSEESI